MLFLNWTANTICELLMFGLDKVRLVSFCNLKHSNVNIINTLDMKMKDDESQFFAVLMCHKKIEGLR